MSGQEDETDKSFEATAQKLDDARKKGEIARSAELLTAASYLGLFLALSVAGYSGLMHLGETLAILLDQAAQLAPLFMDGSARAPAMGIISELAWSIAPIFLTPASVVLVALFATRGIVFAPTKIEPKISKISLIANAKNKYGRSGLFQFFLSFLKLTIYSACLAFFIHYRLDDMVAILHTTPQAAVKLLATICIEFLFVTVIISAVIGGLDAIWQHFEHLRKNRMSRKEVVDETKKNEGDPHLKQERRQRAQSLAGTQMAAEVVKADVIIVNPTHFAVALKWDRKVDRAPVCLAKGVDEVAKRIREIANEQAIPIHSDPPTARALHATTEIGDQIAPEHYRAVAAAIRFAEEMRRRAKRMAF